MTPADSNIDQNMCSNPIGSNCVTVNAQIPGLNSCGNSSLTQVLMQEGTLVNNLIQQLQDLTPVTPPVLDFSTLDLGCLFTATTTTWSCPCPGLVFLADVSAPNGAGYCINPTTQQVVPNCVPVSTTVINTRPTTLAGILQLIINKIPCCDPCNQNNG